MKKNFLAEKQIVVKNEKRQRKFLQFNTKAYH